MRKSVFLAVTIALLSPVGVFAADDSTDLEIGCTRLDRVQAQALTKKLVAEEDIPPPALGSWTVPSDVDSTGVACDNSTYILFAATKGEAGYSTLVVAREGTLLDELPQLATLGESREQRKDLIFALNGILVVAMNLEIAKGATFSHSAADSKDPSWEKETRTIPRGSYEWHVGAAGVLLRPMGRPKAGPVRDTLLPFTRPSTDLVTFESLGGPIHPVAFSTESPDRMIVKVADRTIRFKLRPKKALDGSLGSRDAN